MLALFVCFAAGTCAAEEAIAPADGVIKLFDGKTLGDCHTWLKDTKLEDPRQVFTVDDGMIHVTGDGLGALVTDKRYRDYHLVLEFKWGDRTWQGRTEAARDSGLLVHSNGAEAGTTAPGCRRSKCKSSKAASAILCPFGQR